MMKKTTKRFIALGLTAIMTLGLTACGGGSSSSKKETETATTASGDENTLTVWAWDKSFNIYAMEEAEKIYQQVNPDFKLDIVEVSWNDTQTKLATILGSGNYDQLPDIMLMQDFAYEKYVSTYPDLYLDITDSGIDFSQFSEAKTAKSVVDGKNYGIPFDNGTDIAAYRTDILEEAGYTIDDLTDIDWDRWIEIGSDISEKTGYSLLSVQAGSSDLVYQMMQSAEIESWNDDGSPYMVGNAGMKQCIEIFKKAVDSGALRIVNSWDEYIGTFTSGSTCGVINGCWIMASIQTAEDLSGLWNITNIPSVPGQAKATNYASQGGSTWAITTNCKNAELAYDFFKNTYAGSVEFYETILPNSGALSSYLPAGESDVYNEPQEFYGGQAVFAMVSDFSKKTPSVTTGVYYTEQNTALATLLSNVLSGADIDSELETAESTTKFDMGE